MTDRCRCCTGIDIRTPASVANRPGLLALAYRVGTHASFLETMTASLSRADLHALSRFTARRTDDPAIAWLDAWATIADVLTFYQERIANEGYLRTAVERRSVLELARLIGYDPKPGVASSVYLAYTLEHDHDVVIPAGSRVQSVPGPGELPQTFETAGDLNARAEWNVLNVRTTQPQVLKPESSAVYVKGTATNLRSGDRLLFVIDGQPLTDGENGRPVVPRIVEALAEPAHDRTKLTLQTVEPLKWASLKGAQVTLLNDLTRTLTKAPSIPPPTPSHLVRDRNVLFDERADTVPRLLASLHPEMGSTLYSAFANTDLGGAPAVEVYALRTRAAVFGHNASKRPVIIDASGRVFQADEDWPLHGTIVTGPKLQMTIALAMATTPEGRSTIAVRGRLGERGFEGRGALASGVEFELAQIGSVTVARASDEGLELLIQFSEPKSTVMVIVANRDVQVSGIGIPGTLAATAPIVSVEGPVVTVDVEGVWQKSLRGAPTESGDSISLDAEYPRIVKGSWVVIERPGAVIATEAKTVTERSRSDYGLSARCTVIGLALDDEHPWLKPDDSFEVIRRTSVLTESERLELTEAPIERGYVGGRVIELAQLYGGLESGRWLMVSGERTDLPDTSGVFATELVMLAAVEHAAAPVDEVPLPGDRPHTFIALSTDLAYTYQRDSVRIYGNVVRATHGETRNEILGGGDATRPFLTFALKQLPLTYVSAPTTSGVESTLEVRVNEVRWDETDRFHGLGPTDRRFALRTDDDGSTSVVFGNGREGARTPTGAENIRARYRSGIGRPGNVKARQITLLASRPLGVKEVVNPLPAAGGADREGRDEARRNAPLAVLALEHLVSVRDYADFARTFGGIAKASGGRLQQAGQAVIHVTISGASEDRINQSSDVYRNLTRALHRFGDPALPISIAVRALRILVVEARVSVLDAYQWDFVEPHIRSAMLDAFGFDRRELGQDVSASEVLRVMQSVPGVDAVDLDLLSSIPEEFTQGDLAALRRAAQPLAHHQSVAARLARVDDGVILPAELVVLSPAVPETLLLSELKR